MTMAAILSGYIAVLAVVVGRFAYRNLAGDPHRGRFLVTMGVTAVAVEGLVWADHVVAFLGCWFVASLGVHQLLRHRRDRFEAWVVAWEKAVISRVGDLALLGAALVLLVHTGTLSLSELKTADWSGSAGLVAALLLVLGALTKSAQVPFHGWLPRTLEAPTAVSAFLHAGIINAGGLLLVRFGFLLEAQPAAQALVAAVGGVTALIGGWTLLVQADVKRRLAWSTVGQMGFMMVEIGLGYPELALIHLIGHGLYKAHAFLTSGEAPKPVTAPVANQKTAVATGVALGLWILAGAALVVAQSMLQPGHGPLTAVVWAALLPLAVGGAARAGAAVRSFGLAAVALGTSPFLGSSPSTEGGLRDAVGLAVAAGLLVQGLVVVGAPWLRTTGWYRALFARGLHGMAFSESLTRLVRRVGGAS